MKQGTLFGVGVGPGDPMLMTLKAVQTAKHCPVIAIPHKEREKCTALKIALGAVPELAEKELLAVDMPMTKDIQKLEAAYAAGAAAIASVLAQGKSVCFLTLGDPTVYSTYLYLHQRVAALGYETRIIPGITSFCAAAAELGISLCENKEQLHVIPGTYTPSEALGLPGTKVMMKNDLPKTLEALKAAGAQAAMVENCGMENQHIYPTLEEIPEDAGYFSLLIVKDGKESFSGPECATKLGKH